MPRTGDLPLSFAQQRLWFLDRLLPDKATYNIPAAWRLQGPLDVAALERSLQCGGGAPRDAAHALCPERGRAGAGDRPAAGGGAAAHRSQCAAQAEREARARELADSAKRAQPFDLGRVRCCARSCCAWLREEHLLLLNVHHIVSDGWSMAVLSSASSRALYGAFVRGREPELPALPIQYADYAVWQREWLQGEVLERSSLLEGASSPICSTLELPTDRPRPPVPSYQGARSTFDLPAPLTAGAQGAGPARRGDAVHDAAGGLPGAAATATAARRTSRWARRLPGAGAPSSRG